MEQASKPTISQGGQDERPGRLVVSQAWAKARAKEDEPEAQRGKTQDYFPPGSASSCILLTRQCSGLTSDWGSMTHLCKWEKQ